MNSDRLPYITTPIPGEYWVAMQRLLGADFAGYAARCAEPPSIGLRANTLKLDPADLSGFLPGRFLPITWCPAGCALQGESPPGSRPYHAAGLFYMQDPSAMAAAEILAPQPGERVLDLSAAPGGKTTHLASLMQNEGMLVANEIHPQRVWELAENLERWGAHNAAITNESPERLANHFGAFFDRVLVDAPCSGEGMFRKSEAARRDWSPELVQSCALRQSAILEQAVRLLRPGGRLVYSTCTFNPSENEAVIARLLDVHPNLELLPVPQRLGFDRGRPDWLPPELSRPELEHAVRLWPQHAPGEGHFLALLQKNNKNTDTMMSVARHRSGDLPSESRLLFERFRADSLSGLEVDPGRLMAVGSYLYLLPKQAPHLAGLRVIHPGWWLGIFKKGRFEPAHAMALGLRNNQARRVSDYSVSTPEINAYLRGETLPSPGKDGWVLVCVDGYPLGWGKRAQAVLKNHYPRGLRHT